MNTKSISFAAAAVLVTVLILFLARDQDKAPEEAEFTPAFPEALVETMNRGVSLMGRYQYGEAVAAFEEALTADPTLNRAKLNLAIALFNRNQKEDQDLERSEKLLNEVLQAEPDNLQALYFKGIVLQHIGKAEEAIPCFEQVSQVRTNDGAVWYLLGLCKQRLGQPAEPELLKAVEHKPYLFSAYYKLAQMAMADGDQARATGYLEQFKQLRESPLGEAIELPQYNQMGDLALVRPLAAERPPITRSTLEIGPRRILFTSDTPTTAPTEASMAPGSLGGITLGDVNQDDKPDALIVCPSASGAGQLRLLLQGTDGTFADHTRESGLAGMSNVVGCALGDFDNDERVDLYVFGRQANSLFRGDGSGAFEDVTESTGTSAGDRNSRFAVFLDADHDADLDLLVGHADGLSLLNNNADGTFIDRSAESGMAVVTNDCVAALPGDIDNDRDTDVIILHRDAPALVLINELLMNYRIGEALGARGDRGGVLQDFTGDGELDLLVLGGDQPRAALLPGDGRGHFSENKAFTDQSQASQSWGELRGLRACDADLDGDLDIALFSDSGHLLLNDGRGRFVFRSNQWPNQEGERLLGAEWVDLDGNWVADLVQLRQGPSHQFAVHDHQLTPPSTGLAILPSGVRGRDGRTRSPASGYGVKLSVRTGLSQQTLTYTGLSGGANQHSLPPRFGLDGTRRADYVALHWTDGVAQVETGLPAGQTHRVAEMQRKISSCPVLFTWNGAKFEFITDFAGVGGLGYFVAPGEAAPPQPLEHIKIEPNQLTPRDDKLELRICEPMEETAYVDRLELLAIDHPRSLQVFPDERLAIEGPAPTHDLLVIDEPLFPRQAIGPSGVDCTTQLQHVDRYYAYEPRLDRRFIGFCQPHTLELDFGNPFNEIDPTDRTYLFIRGYIEYPFSQTVYAAGQARVGWEPIRIDRRLPDGSWETIVPDAGVPGGMDRTMTINLTGLVSGPHCRLRLTTNLEVYYDQIFIGQDLGESTVRQTSVPLQKAELRRVGFAREYSPDGRLPLIYDYALIEPTAPFHTLKGAYTRYGPVEALLAEFDDLYALVGPGDEIALEFGTASLPELPADHVRSYLLVSHAYCKDMDLYTATPDTLEPLPFRGMSRYPYPDTEHYPDTEKHRRFHEEYNTRLIE